MALLRCLSAYQLRRLAQSLRRGVLKLLACGIFDCKFSRGWGLLEILLNSFLRAPCMKILQMPCFTGACKKLL